MLVHYKACITCAKQKVQKTQFEKQIFEPGVQPMESIYINLIGIQTSKMWIIKLVKICHNVNLTLEKTVFSMQNIHVHLHLQHAVTLDIKYCQMY